MFSFAFFVFLLIYISHLSLWLDELIEISLLNQFNFSRILKNVAINPGGVPFGYCIEALSLKIFGVTAFAARLPSVIFSLATCLVLAWSSKEFQLRFPVVPVFILALLPIYVRYSLEARPYAQGVFFTACATFILIRVSQHPSLGGLSVFFLITLCSLYTQPYSFFPIGAQVMIISARAPRRLRFQLLAATALAVLLFMPWLWFAKDIWASGIQATVASSGISMRSFLMIAKELFGFGYVGSSVVFSLCGCALWSASLAQDLKLFLLASIFLPIAGVLVADGFTGYFLAIRQMIFVLPSVAILAALGFEVLLEIKWKNFAWLLLTALVISQLTGIVSWFNRPREDWNVAAHMLKENRSRYKCIVFVPEESSNLYTIFDPQLAAWSCSSSELKSASVVAVSTGGASRSGNNALGYSQLKALGFRNSAELNSGEPAITLFFR